MGQAGSSSSFHPPPRRQAEARPFGTDRPDRRRSWFPPAYWARGLHKRLSRAFGRAATGARYRTSASGQRAARKREKGRWRQAGGRYARGQTPDGMGGCRFLEPASSPVKERKVVARPGQAFAMVATVHRAYLVSDAPALRLAAGLDALLFGLTALGGAGAISKVGWFSLIRTLTSPPSTSFPNNSSSASGCLIFS